MRAPALAAAFGAAALAQLCFLAVHAAAALGRVPGQVERFLGDGTAAANAPVLAWRTLPALARLVPPGARTLLVTTVVEPVQYEFYFLPRPFRVLVPLPEALVALVERERPEDGYIVRQRWRQLRARGALLGPERVAELLAWAEYVVSFGGDAPELVAHRERLERVGGRGAVTLYRVRAR